MAGHLRKYHADVSFYRRGGNESGIYIPRLHGMRPSTPIPVPGRVTGAVTKAVKKRAYRRAAELTAVAGVKVSVGAIGVHGLARELNMPDHDPYPALGLPRTQSALALLDLPWPRDDEDDDTSDSGQRAHAIPFRVSEEMDRALTAHAAALGTKPSTVIAHVFAVELDMPDHDPYRRLAKVVMQMAV